MAVSGVGINIVVMILAQLPVLNANTVGKQVIFREGAWRNDQDKWKRLYNAQNKETRIYTCKRSGKRRKDTDYDEGSDDNSEPITVGLGTITSYNAVHSMSIYPRVKSNDTRCIPAKVDSGADTCFLTAGDLQKTRSLSGLQALQCCSEERRKHHIQLRYFQLQDNL